MLGKLADQIQNGLKYCECLYVWDYLTQSEAYRINERIYKDVKANAGTRLCDARGSVVREKGTSAMIYILWKILEFAVIIFWTAGYVSGIIDPIKYCLGWQDSTYDIHDAMEDMSVAFFSMIMMYGSYFIMNWLATFIVE